MTNYSSEMLKKAAFIDEMNNILNCPISEVKYGSHTLSIVRSYIELRIAEIKKEHG